MNEREEKKKENWKGNRGRQRILLTEAEAGKLDFAVGESGELSRSLFISEAIRAGLEGFDAANVEGKRNRRIDAWTPQDLTQQSILRYLILRYAQEAHWKHSGATTQPQEDDRQ